MRFQYVRHLPRRTGFGPSAVHVGFVVDKVTMGKLFCEYFCFPPSVSIINPALILVFHSSFIDVFVVLEAYSVVK